MSNGGMSNGGMSNPRDRLGLLAGLALVIVAFVIYWLSNRSFDAGRADFFYLADAFIHGRIWLNFLPGPNDIVMDGPRVYVPFGPFPAVALMPLVAVLGPTTAAAWQTGVNAALAAIDVGLCWWLVTRLGVRRLLDRAFLAVLFGFSTQIWWVTTRGGVWHTGHLIAVMLTLAVLIELEGKRRPVLIGLLAGAAFLTRAPLAFAIPFYALFLLVGRASDGERPWWLGGRDGLNARAIAAVVRPWSGLVLGVLPALVFFLWYNAARFGSPFESGYALATLPDWLAQIRAAGLFSVNHVSMNVDYLFLHLPKQIPDFPYFRPDGLGMSIFVTSPGLFGAVRANWREARSWLLFGAMVATLLPNLLYYGGGWLQYGYRYALDAIPFAFALCGIAAARHGVGWIWRLLIAFGVIVGLGGVYWAYNLH